MMTTLGPGDIAPPFTLFSGNGKVISLQSYLGKKDVILYFYPKDSTPGCTNEACDFQKNLSRIKKDTAIVLGVSRDSLASHKRFSEKYKLSFSLLSDPEAEVCEAYGVFKLKKLYGREYWGIERSTFIIGLDGRIIEAFRGVRVAGHVDQVRSVLKTAQAARKIGKPPV
ncbi:MAG: peroxiredoxin [Nitrospiria bacterium]